MTKQELIIAAYGEHWDKVKDFVDENGWLEWGWRGSYGDPNPCSLGEMNEITGKDHSYKHVKHQPESKEKGWGKSLFRPKVLNGLDDNNGWNHIVSHGEVSPPKTDTEVLYDICDIGAVNFQDSIIRGIKRIEVFVLFPESATHWRIRKEEPKPLY